VRCVIGRSPGASTASTPVGISSIRVVSRTAPPTAGVTRPISRNGSRASTVRTVQVAARPPVW
jgi:hypothetical protein